MIEAVELEGEGAGEVLVALVRPTRSRRGRVWSVPAQPPYPCRAHAVLRSSVAEPSQSRNLDRARRVAHARPSSTHGNSRRAEKSRLGGGARHTTREVQLKILYPSILVRARL